MSYGLEITRPNGRTMLAPASRGGVFVGLYTANYGVTGNWTFPNIPAGGLTPYMVAFGGHQVVVGSSGGVATLTLNPVIGASAPANFRVPTTIAVCARITNEGNYGLLLTSEDGERSISSLYAVPVYLGKLTFSATPTSSATTGANGFTRYTHTVSTSLGPGRTRMILWAIPSSALDVWYTGTSFIPSSVTGATSVNLTIIRAAATTPVIPQAYVFALDGLAASGSAYGLQCFNASGALTYDSNLAHWRSLGLASYSYPATSSGPTAINTYTMADYALATTPLLLIQPYHFEAWSSGSPSTAIVYDGAVRRSGTTLYTRTPQTGTDSEDAPRGGSYASALSAGIAHLILDGADY